jgi:hypothetical protein
MPFSKDFDDVYKLGIKEPAANLDIVAERVDEQIFSEGILDRIYLQIDAADIIIADMSGQNPNVFYEVGYAHGKGKLCILLTQDVADIPFDLKHHRHIVYEGSALKLRSSLSEDLKWAKSQIGTQRESKIKVRVKSANGNLDVNKYYVKGSVDFKLDLFNETNENSPEIEAIYFYVSKDWEVSQDGAVCPTTDSDLPPAKHRHFLKSPVRRLQKNSWAQLQFTTKRILAFATKGEELKNSYKVGGQFWLRIITDKGHFDYEFSLCVMCSEFTF